MSNQSNIGWTNATWNFIVGCARVSTGCAKCYAVGFVWRLAHSRFPHVAELYKGLVQKEANGQLNWTGKVRVFGDRIKDPIRWRNPRRIFVASMSDPFHPSVRDDIRVEMLAVAMLTPRHEYQCLTKRPDLMARFLAAPSLRDRVIVRAKEIAEQEGLQIDSSDYALWPLHHFLVGTSIENQKAANARAPYLCKLGQKGWRTFASVEPMIGPVSLARWLYRINWVIYGGESGQAPRPCALDWIEDGIEECGHHGTAVFVKQTGSRPTYAGIAYPVTGQGTDPSEWPAELRVQDYPRSGFRPTTVTENDAEPCVALAWILRNDQ